MSHRDKACRACRGEHARICVLGILTPNESVWFPEHLGGSDMVFLKVLMGFLWLYGLECWVLTLGELIVTRYVT